jgi:hypothetical protein
MDYPEELGNWPTMYEYQHAVTLCVVVGLNGSRVAMYVEDMQKIVNANKKLIKESKDGNKCTKSI